MKLPGTTRSSLRIALAFLLGSVLGYAVSQVEQVDRSIVTGAHKSRVATIRRHAAQIAPGQLIAIGDSTAEGERLTRLCGLEVLNAGLNGALIREEAVVARSAIAASKPSIAVFTIGINNLNDERDATWPAREREFTDLFDLWPGRPIIVGLTAMPGVPTDLVERANGFLVAETARRHGIYIPPLERRFTEDGIHADAAGAPVWQARVEQACARLRRPG